MHHFVTEMCTRVNISVTKWCIMGYGTGALWDLCNRSFAIAKLVDMMGPGNAKFGKVMTLTLQMQTHACYQKPISVIHAVSVPMVEQRPNT